MRVCRWIPSFAAVASVLSAGYTTADQDLDGWSKNVITCTGWPKYHLQWSGQVLAGNECSVRKAGEITFYLLDDGVDVVSLVRHGFRQGFGFGWWFREAGYG